MRFLKASSSLLAFVALSSLATTALAKPYPAHIPELARLHNVTEQRLELRDCANPCGYYGQLCCASGESCYTDASNQAQCGAAAVTAAATTGGQWMYYTSTWVETGLVTHTSVYSSYVGATAAATPTGTCTGAQSPCGGICCDSGYYCLTSGQCALVGAGSSGGVSGTLTPSAPLRPTSSGLIIVTATGTPTTTVPFSSPIATGANGTMTPVASGGGGGLSGGAIAGIVIGVLFGILLLLLLCLFCCARALFDTCLACFGLGNRNRKHTHEETYIEEHRHSSAAGAGGRRWYGDRPGRPRPPKKAGGGFGNALGIGALLGGAAIALGLKRRHDKHKEEKSEYTGSSYYTDYTSTSEYFLSLSTK
ncbi:uncharacterized protein BDZ99DRAFT_135493 [Mytilinidion resinicola]|uniref:Mid2 domain-containing protein n=1 Tax=Mytilinidion resinicola TaxID=574789 RepID=A0A6A6Z5L8_9PEZI|nr:uncharacterized protein BDZ99DRAFT_135493 [Mytilinidion resinicola]KAF2816402.1 hypothetical protein BDZ99DRAFT_135493 [Mytilinidion resinicola]